MKTPRRATDVIVLPTIIPSDSTPRKKSTRGRKPMRIASTTEEREAVQVFLERWKSGESLASLARELQHDKARVTAWLGGAPKRARRYLSRSFAAVLGGKAAMKALRAQGAGARVLFSGKRGTRRKVQRVSVADGGTVHVRTDDAGVPFTVDTTAANGWTWSRFPTPFRLELLHTSPDGESYVAAQPTERADLIVLSQTVGLPNVRLRRYETSSLHRQVKRAQRADEAREERQQDKRAAKEAPTPTPDFGRRFTRKRKTNQPHNHPVTPSRRKATRKRQKPVPQKTTTPARKKKTVRRK